MKGRRTSRRISRVLYPTRARRVAAIHLDLPLPTGSSDLPAGSGGPPSSTCANPLVSQGDSSRPCSGWGLPSHSDHSECWWSLTPPFHPYRPLANQRPAVCFLWHFPAGHPGLPLTTTLPCGARTFLGEPVARFDATARSARPPPTNHIPAVPIRRIRIAVSPHSQARGQSRIRASASAPARAAAGGLFARALIAFVVAFPVVALSCRTRLVDRFDA